MDIAGIKPKVVRTDRKDKDMIADMEMTRLAGMDMEISIIEVWYFFSSDPLQSGNFENVNLPQRIWEL